MTDHLFLFFGFWYSEIRGAGAWVFFPTQKVRYEVGEKELGKVRVISQAIS